MDAASVLAALTGAEGFAASWDEGATLLTLTGTSLPPGTHTPTIGTGATDAHGRPLQAPASRSVTVPAPEQPPAPTPSPAPAPSPPPATADPGRVPGAPTGVAASVVGGIVHVVWSAPTDGGSAPITSYHLYRRADGALVSFATVPGTAFDDASVAPGHAYGYAVAAVNAAGEGPRSGEASATVPRPDAPTSALVLAPATPDGLAGWYLAPPTASLSAAPAGAAVRYHLDGDVDQDHSAPFLVPVGAHTIHWHAEQPGAPAEAEHAQDVLVDGAAPVLDRASFSAPNATQGGSVVLTVDAHDDASGIASAVAFLSDGSSVPLGGSGPYTARIGPSAIGTYGVDVVLTDHAGRATRQTVGSVRIDAALLESTSVDPTPDEVLTPADVGSAGGSGTSGGTGGAGGGPLPSTSSPAPSPAPSAAAPPSPVVTVTPKNASLDLAAGARGELTIRVQNAEHPESVSFVAIASDGTETQLGSGSSATWDTTQNPDGYYTVEAREQRADGTTFTIASTRVLVRNSFATVGAAAGSIALGVGAAALTSAATNAFTSGSMGAASSAASSVVTSSGSGSFSFTQYLKDLFVDAGSDSLRDRTKDIASIERRRKLRSAVALVLTVALIAVFYSIAEAKPLSFASVVEQLPFIGVAAVILAFQKYGTESIIAHVTGARVRFRLWIAGVLSLLASTLVFHEPFGYPGYVDNGEEETEAQKRLAGRRALAILGSTAGWGLVFVAIAHLGNYELGSIGLSMAVTVLATSAMPFGPLPGAEVWRWNKLVSVGAAVAALAVYVTYEMALLPEWAYVSIGVVGAASYVATTLHYRRIRQPPRRVPVQDGDAEADLQRSEHDAKTRVEVK